MFTNGARWTALGFGGCLVVLATTRGETAVARVAQDTVPPPSATLLRRLAAAADGYRTGEPIYVVTSYEYPYTVIAVAGTRDSALSRARALGRSTAIYGPYVTPLDFGRPSVLLMLGHVRPTVWTNDSAPVWREQDIDSVAVTIYHHSRGPWRKVTHGLDHDAIFFTLSAIDKFALPYYAQLYGPAYADSIRRSLGAYISSTRE